MTIKRINILKYLKPAVLVAVLLCPLFLIAGRAAATTYLAQTFIMFNRMQVSTPTTGTVCAAQSSTATDIQVTVTFPAGYVSSTTLSNWAVNATSAPNWPTGATGWPGIGTQATAATISSATFASTTLTPATLYCFNWTNTAALTTGSSPSTTNSGSITTYSSGPTQIDTGTYITDTLTGDQILVTASVPSVFSFVLSNTTDSLGSLATNTIVSSPTPRTVTINTNAKNGWILWAKDQYGGLESLSQPSDTIPYTSVNNPLITSAQGYNTGVTVSQTGGTQTPTPAASFTGGTVGKGGDLSTTYATIASNTGTSNAAIVTLTNNIVVLPTTPAAADYTDTITLVGAGQF